MLQILKFKEIYWNYITTISLLDYFFETLFYFYSYCVIVKHINRIGIDFN